MVETVTETEARGANAKPMGDCDLNNSKTVRARKLITHTFNGPLYQKGKTNLDFIGARDSE